MSKDQKSNPFRGCGISRLLNTALLAAGGWIIYSRVGIDHAAALPDAIAAGRKSFFSRIGQRLSYYADTAATGRPLVLLHSINAAASAYEMRPLFEYYRVHRPVYALDLPGYGFSDRPRREYTPQLFQNAIIDFLENEVAQPADVIALSLSSEFAAATAQARPELFHSLTVISPTGLSGEKQKRASQQAGRSGSSSRLHAGFSFPLWGRAFFDLVSTRASIRYFLQQSFVRPVPEAMVAYAYQTAHQPGAEHVPLYFISGSLFTPDIRTRVYQYMSTPGLVIYDHDAFTSFDRLPVLLHSAPNWQAERIIPTKGLPHWEQLAQTAATLDAFWAGLG